MILLALSLMFHPIVQPMYQTYIQFRPSEYTTPLKVLEENHRVKRGFVCWHPFEVVCIDDVCAETGKSYWVVKVNGDSLHYNANSRIKPTDLVEWEFRDGSYYWTRFCRYIGSGLHG